MLMSIEEQAGLFASMTVAKRLGVDLSGDLEVMVPRVRAALDAWRAEVGPEVAAAELAKLKAVELAALQEEAAAKVKAKADAEAARRWGEFDVAAAAVVASADRLDAALKEAASARRALRDASAEALRRFPGGAGVVAFLGPRETQQRVEHAVLRAGAGDEPEALGEALGASLRTLETLRAVAGAA